MIKTIKINRENITAWGHIQLMCRFKIKYVSAMCYGYHVVTIFTVSQISSRIETKKPKIV